MLETMHDHVPHKNSQQIVDNDPLGSNSLFHEIEVGALYKAHTGLNFSNRFGRAGRNVYYPNGETAVLPSLRSEKIKSHCFKKQEIIVNCWVWNEFAHGDIVMPISDKYFSVCYRPNTNIVDAAYAHGELANIHREAIMVLYKDNFATIPIMQAGWFIKMERK